MKDPCPPPAKDSFHDPSLEVIIKMFWANDPSLDMLAHKIDDMLNAKQMLLA